MCMGGEERYLLWVSIARHDPAAKATQKHAAARSGLHDMILSMGCIAECRSWSGGRPRRWSGGTC